MDPSEREKRERQAFDDYALASQISDASLRVSPADIERYSHPFTRKHFPIDLLFSVVGDVRGKRVLDLGCGDGLWTVLLALFGAQAVGVELSSVHADIAVRRARTNGVADRVAILQGSAHYLPFASETFDVVFGNAILHHLDIETAAPEIHRVLRTGGRGVFSEPVALSRNLRRLRESWPFAAMVKKAAVSPDEEPLTPPRIESLARPFAGIRLWEAQLLSRLSRIVGEGKPYEILNATDRVLIRAFPFLRRFARCAIIEVTK